jgi:hypothetical protein
VNTASRHRLELPSAVVVVNRIPGAVFIDFGGWHPVYGYTVRDPAGRIVVRGRDLRGPAGRYMDADAPPAERMVGVLLGALDTAGKRYRFEVVHQHVPTSSDHDHRGAKHYVPTFTLEVDRWAHQHRKEIAAALNSQGAVRDSRAARDRDRTRQMAADSQDSPSPPPARGAQMGPGV